MTIYSCFVFVQYSSELSSDTDSVFFKKNCVLDEISDLLDDVKTGIKSEFNKLFVENPSQHFDSFHLNLTHPALTIIGDFNNGTLVWTEPSLKLWTFKPEGLEIFNMTLDSLYINGTYAFDGYIGEKLFNLYGNGSFHVNFTKFSVAAISSLEINSTSLCVPVSVNVYLVEAENNYENFMDGDEELDPLLNRVFELLMPDAVRVVWRDTADETDSYIQSIIDKILNGNTSESLSKLLYSYTKIKDKLT